MHFYKKPERFRNLCCKVIVFNVKFYSSALPLHGWQWVLGGGVGVPCTANPLYGGLTAEAEAQKAVWTLISETVTIRPLRLAVSERFP